MTVALDLDRESSLLREHRAFLGVIALSTLGLFATGQAAPLADLPSILLVSVLLGDLALLTVVWTRLREHTSWQRAWTVARIGPLSNERFGGLALAVIGTRWLLLTAVAWKSSLPALHPFAFDVELHQLDRLIHGTEAWRLLPVPRWTMPGLDLFYRFWYPALAGVVLWRGWQPASPERRRFLLALALTWTVGSVLAVIFSSAGPVYYERLTGDPVYAPLIERLAGLPARTIQEALWGTNGRGSTAVIAGIAAMPSLHVACPALYAVSSRGKLRLFWIVFTMLTLVGSILTGWHYAVDGYVGVLLALGCWRAARGT